MCLHIISKCPCKDEVLDEDPDPNTAVVSQEKPRGSTPEPLHAVHQTDLDKEWEGFLYCPPHFEKILYNKYVPACDQQVCRFPEIYADCFKPSCLARMVGFGPTRAVNAMENRKRLKQDLWEKPTLGKPILVERAWTWQWMAEDAKAYGQKDEFELCVEMMRRVFGSKDWRTELNIIWGEKEYKKDVEVHANKSPYNRKTPEMIRVREEMLKRFERCPYL